MSRRAELICNRCGRTIVNLDRCGTNMVKEYSAKIHYWGVGQPRSYGEQRIDLCAECAEKFVRFLGNEEGIEND